jgi:hypothetical protein
MKSFSILIACALLTATTSFAATADTAGAAAKDTTSITQTPEAKKSSSANSLVLGYKSFNETGRFGYTDDAVSKDAFAGRVYKGKHEARLGYKHSSGWGGYAQMTQYRYDYKDSLNNNNKWSMSDPSITLNHPAFYADDTLKVFGSIRYYIPTTDRSKRLNTQQYSYYLDAVYSLGDGAELYNQFNPRYFSLNSYGLTDTRVRLEDFTTYTKKIGNWGRWGVGQWTQFEEHPNSPNGMTTDVFPLFDYMITSKIFLGPRVYLPVYSKDFVYDGSRSATLSNAYFQLYIQASL